MDGVTRVKNKSEKEMNVDENDYYTYYQTQWLLLYDILKSLLPLKSLTSDSDSMNTTQPYPLVFSGYSRFLNQKN